MILSPKLGLDGALQGSGKVIGVPFDGWIEGQSSSFGGPPSGGDNERRKGRSAQSISDLRTGDL